MTPPSSSSEAPSRPPYDIENIPYLDDTLDAVLRSHVLERVPDDGAAMAEGCRVLRPDGFAILHVSIERSREQTFEDDRIVSPEGRERGFGQHEHASGSMEENSSHAWMPPGFASKTSDRCSRPATRP